LIRPSRFTMIAAMTDRRPYHSRPIMVMLCLVAPGSAVVCAPVGAQTLRELLPVVAAEARAPHPLRAEVRIERDGRPAGEAVLLARGRRVYLETRAGMRALLSPGKVVVVRDGRVVRATPGTVLEGTDLLLEDLEPFGTRSLSTPQVSDETPAKVVVTGAPPPPSAYVLLVHTIDRERNVIVQTKFYRDSISNLVKIRHDDDFVQVGGRWRPSTMTVETFREPSTTRLTLGWREAPAAPAVLFTPAGLRSPSPLTWP
jgi:Outer membrane lipoprotein-sorting protein